MERFENTAPDLSGAFNICRAHNFVARQVKFCPFCGQETEHVPPERRCQHCGEVVLWRDAKFCGMCGGELDPCPDTSKSELPSPAPAPPPLS